MASTTKPRDSGDLGGFDSTGKSTDIVPSTSSSSLRQPTTPNDSCKSVETSGPSTGEPHTPTSRLLLEAWEEFLESGRDEQRFQNARPVGQGRSSKCATTVDTEEESK